MKILCLGSLNIDHVYAVEHFVQAGETTSALSLADHCGGKGLNQALALKRAGCDVFMAGKIGTDGQPLLNLLQENGVNTDYIEVTPDSPTGHAIIQVDKTGQNCIIIHGGANHRIDPAYVDKVYAGFAAGDIVLLQNEISSLPYAIEQAQKAGLRVALNPSPMDTRLAACPQLQLVDWFILNEIEGNHLTGQTDPKKICLTLKEKYPRAAVMLTLGKQGCLYYDGTAFAAHGIYKLPVVDTTAAGDTFTGYFLAGVQQSLPVDRILELASKASSLAVSVAGAAPSIPLRQQVEAACLTPLTN